MTFTDDLVIHMVELPKVAAKSDESDRHLRQWCEFLMNASHLDTDALPESMSNPAIRKAMETLREISENEHERALYESRRQKQLDDMSLAAGYAKRDRFYAQKDVEIAQKEEQFRRKEEEYRRKEEENRRKEEENRRKEEENRNVRLAMAKRIETLAAQLQRLADSTENPDTKAEFLRQRDAQLQEAETMQKALRDNS